jgi:hypothetical protein
VFILFLKNGNNEAQRAQTHTEKPTIAVTSEKYEGIPEKQKQ